MQLPDLCIMIIQSHPVVIEQRLCGTTHDRHTIKSSVLDFLLTDSVSLQRGEQHDAKSKPLERWKPRIDFDRLSRPRCRWTCNSQPLGPPHMAATKPQPRLHSYIQFKTYNSTNSFIPPVMTAEPALVKMLTRNTSKLCKFTKDLKINF